MSRPGLALAREHFETNAWQATKARAALSEIIDAAVDGTPQFFRHRDGKEVVVISREHFQISKPNLRDYLLRSGYAPDHDAFDDTMRAVQTSFGAAFNPRALDFDA